jgi:hypothetical protein
MKNKKNTHITKDGRVARKGLYYYMNRAKKLGKSKKEPGKASAKTGFSTIKIKHPKTYNSMETAKTYSK